MKPFNMIVLAALTLTVGCAQSETESNSVSSTAGNTEYLLTTEPADAMPVGAARESVENEQSVTVVGLIGGSSEPFVDGLAAFTIVDPKVPYCAAEEGCPTPWDYCCTQDQVKDNIATVKMVDASGEPETDDARQLLGVKELSTVVVTGIAQRDDAGNLTVAATQVFVRPGR